jgi:PAS domain S-box-containing protein
LKKRKENKEVERKEVLILLSNLKGPQEQYIFQFKMEEPKKSKKQKIQQPPNSGQIQVSPVSTHSGGFQNEMFNLLQQPSNLQKYQTPFGEDDKSDSGLSLNLSLETSEQPKTQENNMIISNIISNLEASNSSCFVSLLDGCFVSVSSQFSSSVGYTPEELESTMYQNIIHPDDRNMSNILIIKLLASDCESVTHDVRIVEPSGQVNLFVQEINAIRNKHGQFQWLVYRILSQKKTIEIVNHEEMNENYLFCFSYHQLKKEELLINSPILTFKEILFQTLQNLFHSSQPCCFYDSESVIIWNNYAFDTLFGGQNQNFIGRKATELESIKGTAMDILTKSILEEKPLELECQFVPSGGESKNSAVKCVGHKIDLINDEYCFLWFFSMLDPEEQKQFKNSTELVLSEELNIK